MTDGNGQKVSLERADWLKLFVTVSLAVGVPLGAAMMGAWRDVAVLRTRVESLAQTMDDIKADLRHLRHMP